MNLSAFVISGAALMIQQYSEYYRKLDLEKTLIKLEPDSGIPSISKFDYIIVGAGTAGCLLATRLSEHYEVLLLEKGGEPVPLVQPLQYYVEYRHNPEINDAYRLMPQEHFGLNNPGVNSVGSREAVDHSHLILQDKFVYTGKMLGGSGSHNYNVYNRGHPQDYDHWANLTEDDSWRYENVLQHYKRIEDFTGTLVKEDERYLYYGHGGPMQINTGNPPHLSAWLAAGKELGYSVADASAHQTQSFSPMQISMRNGVRESSYTAYLKPVRSRRTLTILKYSEVDKILLEGKGAYGVTYMRHGIPQIAHARHEIILSAGTFASPVILIKSGIGPRELLSEAGIPEVANLPGVGQNLHEHVWVSLSYKSEANITSINDIQLQSELKKFHQQQRHGLLTQFNMAQAFIASNASFPSDLTTKPDILIASIIDLLDPTKHTVAVGLGKTESIGQICFNVSAYKSGMRDSVKLIRPDFKYFTAEKDINLMVKGLKVARKVYEDTKAFKLFKLKFVSSVPQACQNLSKKSDNFWKCYIRRRSTSADHNVGTCKMGLKTDETAVVDSTLRVIGVNGIRVVDGSVIPVVTNANINAPILLIAEKIAAEILRDGRKFVS